MAHTWRRKLGTFFGLSIWLGGNMLVLLVFLTTLLLLPRPWAVAAMAIQITLILVPIDIKPPGVLDKFLAFSVQSATDYFPITVVYEDRDAFTLGTAYIIGYEPHSVLPLGMNMFTRYAPDTPTALKGHVMGTSTVFLAPLMRHMCWWLGIRPVSRDVIKRTLAAGVSCALCPGGVQECLYMQEGKEVVFLRKRTGFVKIALEHGAPLVPVFAFGQTPHYNYSRPFIDWPRRVVPSGAHPVSRFARQIGYLPMLVWGWMGTAMPRRVPMYVVVGRPIHVPHVEAPSPGQVQDYLDNFIAELERLFEAHKAQAGHPHEQLLVY